MKMNFEPFNAVLLHKMEEHLLKFIFIREKVTWLK